MGLLGSAATVEFNTLILSVHFKYLTVILVFSSTILVYFYEFSSLGSRFLIKQSIDNFCSLFATTQEEIIDSGGQVEPPGMHMIFLPYSDDIRHAEEVIIVYFDIVSIPHLFFPILSLLLRETNAVGLNMS